MRRRGERPAVVLDRYPVVVRNSLDLDGVVKLSREFVDVGCPTLYFVPYRLRSALNRFDPRVVIGLSVPGFLEYGVKLLPFGGQLVTHQSNSSGHIP